MDPFSAMALIGAGSGIITNVWNAREAAKNRRFQAEMSSSAHTREVADLRRAGINPMLSRMGSGASAPGGDRAQMEDVGSKAFSAAQLVLLRKQAALTDAQAQGEVARTQGQQISNQLAHSGQAFQLDKLRDESKLAALSVSERQQLMPFVVKQAEILISQTASSARAANARALLDELARTGAFNEQQWEAAMGELSPGLRNVLNIIRTLMRPR